MADANHYNNAVESLYTLKYKKHENVFNSL